MKNAAVMFGRADHGTEAQQAVAPPAGNDRNVSINDTERTVPESAQGVPAYDQRGVVVVASIWLALYVAMIVSTAISPTNRNQQAPLTAQVLSGTN